MTRWRYLFPYKGSDINIINNGESIKITENSVIILDYAHSDLQGKLIFKWKVDGCEEFIGKAFFDNCYGKIIKLHFKKDIFSIRLPTEIFKVFDQQQVRFQNYDEDKLVEDMQSLGVKANICANDKVDHPNTYGYVPKNYHSNYSLYYVDEFGGINDIKMRVPVESETNAVVALYNYIERDCRRVLARKDRKNFLIQEIENSKVKHDE